MVKSKNEDEVTKMTIDVAGAKQAMFARHADKRASSTILEAGVVGTHLATYPR